MPPDSLLRCQRWVDEVASVIGRAVAPTSNLYVGIEVQLTKACGALRYAGTHNMLEDGSSFLNAVRAFDPELPNGCGRGGVTSSAKRMAIV